MVAFSPSVDVVTRIENGEEPILAIRSPLLRHLNRATVFRWVMNGKLPAVRMGRQFFTVHSAIRESLLAGSLDEPVTKGMKEAPVPSDHAAAVARLEARFKGNKPAAKEGGEA